MPIRSRTDLLKAIERLPSDVTFQRRSYKKSWLNWLANYEDFSRRVPDRSAKFIFNALNRPEWIIWLAAAAGTDDELVQKAIHTIDRTKLSNTQAAAVRDVLRWDLISEQLENPDIHSNRSYDDLVPDLDAIYRSKEKQTTKQTLIEARLGQGQFRSQVAHRWNNRCAITGCAIMELLRASHIKPWSQSSNNDRLNPANGVLLAAHLDALFDCGLISFADDGAMLVSDHVGDELKQFGVPRRLRREPTKEERRFLAYHRRYVFAA